MGTHLLQRKGAQQPTPHFRPMSVVAKRSPISASAELLLSLFIGSVEVSRHVFGHCVCLPLTSKTREDPWHFGLTQCTLNIFTNFVMHFCKKKTSQNIGSVRKGRPCSCTILGFNGVGPSILEIQVQNMVMQLKILH